MIYDALSLFFISFEFIISLFFKTREYIFKMSLNWSNEVSLLWEEFCLELKIFFFKFSSFHIGKHAWKIKSYPDEDDVEYKKYWYKNYKWDIKFIEPEKIDTWSLLKNLHVDRYQNQVRNSREK